jgi:putative Mn2+ efflux pump MntP
MKNKATYIVSGLIVLVGAYFIYNKFYKKTPRTKEENINLIVSNKKSSNKDNILSTFEDDFIKEWANGVERNTEVFMYKNNSYYTEGGSRVK